MDAKESLESRAATRLAARSAGLTSVEAPRVAVLACSDAPWDAASLFDGPVCRVLSPGNLVSPEGEPSAAAVTVEHAVVTLGVEAVVVCGHEGCDAMAALLDPRRAAQRPAFAAWIGNAESTRAHVAAACAGQPFEERHYAAIVDNVWRQLQNLESHAFIASRLRAGTLSLHGWIVEADGQTLLAYAPEYDDFVRVAPADPA